MARVHAMTSSVTVRMFDTCHELAFAAAERIAHLATEAVERRGRFVIALSGGSTPRETYERLANAPFRTQVPWQDVHVCWGDERMVPATDAASNYRMAYEAFLKYVDIPSYQVHRVPTNAGAPERVARTYAATLHDVFASTEGVVPAFDLLLLGMGTDGHTASLFPGSPALAERARLVVATPAGENGVRRVTITPPVIEHAREVMMLVCGPEKARTMSAVIDGPLTPERYPAQLVRRAMGNVTWFVSHPARDFTRCT